MTADQDFLEGALTHEIIGSFYCVYNALGYGFLEAVYQRALAHELAKRGIRVEREYLSEVLYDSVVVGHYRADMVAERKVVVETKASERLVEADRKQILNYLRATNLEVGLLLHFGPKPRSNDSFTATHPNRFVPTALSSTRVDLRQYRILRSSVLPLMTCLTHRRGQAGP